MSASLKYLIPELCFWHNHKLMAFSANIDLGMSFMRKG